MDGPQLADGPRDMWTAAAWPDGEGLTDYQTCCYCLARPAPAAGRAATDGRTTRPAASAGPCGPAGRRRMDGLPDLLLLLRSAAQICIVLPVLERGPTGRVTREERAFFRSERTGPPDGGRPLRSSGCTGPILSESVPTKRHCQNVRNTATLALRSLFSLQAVPEHLILTDCGLILYTKL
jgi:hypothetical protein